MFISKTPGQQPRHSTDYYSPSPQPERSGTRIPTRLRGREQLLTFPTEAEVPRAREYAQRVATARECSQGQSPEIPTAKIATNAARRQLATRSNATAFV